MKNLVRLSLKILLILVVLVLLFEYAVEKGGENTHLMGVWNALAKGKNCFVSGLNSIVDHIQNKDKHLGLAGIPAVKEAEETIRLDRFWIGVAFGMIVALFLGWLLKG